MDERDETAGGDDVSTMETVAGTMVEGPVGGREAAPLARGRALGRYLIVDRLGAGGMGVVYRAFDPELDRSVALKLVGFDPTGTGASDNERARLAREAQAMARLSHPNVIAVYDVGTLGETVFVAMELVDGVTLNQWIAERNRTWDEILPVFIEAGRGVVAAHEAGLIHRDFKPDNVMVGRDGRVRVLDFGLARATGAEPPSAPEVDEVRTGERDSLSRSMTAAGSVMGTPAYMAPEQHLGSAAGAPADQFAFCVALFEALFGRRPFTGDSLATLSMSVLSGKITMPPGTKGKAPSWVMTALSRGLRTDPADRFESMQALLDALSHDPSRRRRTVALGLGAVAVLGIGAVAGSLLSRSEPTTAAASTLCTGADEAIAPVWSPSRRDEIGAAFAATGVSYAADAWKPVATLLDDKAAAWADEHTAACRATRVTGELSTEVLDLRMACLDRHKDRLDGLANALAEPDADTVGRAFDAARRLPDPARCGDLDELRQLRPPPQDPEKRAELATLSRKLEAVRSEVALGRLTAARQRLTPLLPRVEALDVARLSADALQLDADLQVDTGEVNTGVDTQVRAYTQAVVAGDDRLAARIAHGAGYLIGYRQAKLSEGLRWISIGRATVERIGGDEELMARFHSAEGATYVAAGDYEHGLAAHQRSREYWARADPTGPDLAAVLNDIGAAMVVQGNVAEAIELHREALRLKELAYGDVHPQVSASARELGAALSQAHEYDAALKHFERVLAINRETTGGDDIHTAAVLDDIGRVLRRTGKLDEAIEHHRRALTIWEKALGDPHPDLAVSILNVGYTLNAAERFEDALVEFQRALAMFDATVGPVHAYIVYASNSVASGLVDLDRYAEARPHVERVLAMDVQVDPTLIAETKFIYTHVLWASGTPSDRAKARRMAAEALASYKTQAERWGPQIEQIDAWLAEHR